ncbi:MAG: sarcosine oxidase subunit alpha family protein [Rhodobacteraceae bacterium]|nr:sarcosine oxidase subunit alpha family protein [Paracoccaceae bacterium]
MKMINRLSQGGRIDRSKPLAFEFDGKTYQGFQGDTLASALLANDIRLVARSFKYHRPRGIMSAGLEEPNALVCHLATSGDEPNRLATELMLYDGLKATSQNNWPNLKNDINAVNSLFARFIPAGFYYKTFMKPHGWWHKVYEPVIRAASGIGKSPERDDTSRYEARNAFCDVLVVGSGVSGLMAALTAGRSGAKVMLVEAAHEFGGHLLDHPGTPIDGAPASTWIENTAKELKTLDNVTVMDRTLAFGYYDHNLIAASQRIDGNVTERLWRIRAKQVILATGAIERPLVFADNDRPGVMLAGAVATYINRHAVLPGKQVVVFTNNDTAYHTALAAKGAGGDVTIIDTRKVSGSALSTKAREAGIAIHTNAAVVAVKGKQRVTAVQVGTLSDNKQAIASVGEVLPCDLLAMSGGWSPTVQLHMQGRGKLVWNDELAIMQPSEVSITEPHVCAGSANGAFDLASGLQDAIQQTEKVLQRLGMDASATVVPEASGANDLATIEPVWRVPVLKGKRFHEFQNDSTAEDLSLAVREGLISVEHVKRYTTTGMATDQGKTANLNGLAIIAEELDRAIPEVGTTTFRPPFHPVTFGMLANTRQRDFFAPIRKTPIHEWHEKWGAPMEPVGDWLRPWWFPKDGEDMHASVTRECLAVRGGVGMADASTLGKIDIQGKDAAEFLNRVYTNAWSKLKPGHCRYGLMLNEQGFVFDDGVTTCLSDDHFHMTTTSGGAARVMTWLEDWAQTEWSDLDVSLTSVTEQWAVMQLSGPRARDVLARLTDIDLDKEAFPFMTMREGKIAGVDARVFRISFTGELSYEINVPSRFGLYVWEQIFAAGEADNITPYGNEAMHVLRAEKGFIIVGQDTDGTVTPMDLGMDWIVSKVKPDFLGKRSFDRPAIKDGKRKHLVGLMTEDPKVVLPDGVHLTEQKDVKIPVTTDGYVTSTYFSPVLGHSIAMGMVDDGRDRMGQTLFAQMLDGSSIPVKIGQSVFYDKEGERTRG